MCYVHITLSFVCSFSRVVFALLIQEGQDISFSDDNYLFFLSGDEQGKSKQIDLNVWNSRNTVSEEVSIIVNNFI